MTNRFYSTISLILLCVLLLLFFVMDYSDKLGSLFQSSIIFLIFNLLKPVLAITTLFFGIYCFKTKINLTNKAFSPIWLIVFGGLFVVLSYVPAISGYYISNKTHIDTFTVKQIIEIKEHALSPEKKAIDREAYAGFVYLQTGETVNFLNSKDQLKIYTPSSTELEERNKRLQLTDEIQKSKSFIKINFIYHMVIFFTSLILFPLIVKSKPPETQKCLS